MLDKVNWFCVDNNVTTEKKARTANAESPVLCHQGNNLQTRFTFSDVITAKANLKALLELPWIGILFHLE